MNASVQVKVCGLTRKADIALALALGAYFCGVIVFEKSPRAVSLEKAQRLCTVMPSGRQVVVDVAPSSERLEILATLGFSHFQIHFDPTQTAPAQIAAWSRLVGRSALWLAPRLPDGVPFPESLLDMADTFLLDTFQKNGYGGSGAIGDWGFFARQKNAFPEKRWLLAGGLNPQNIAEALAATEAEWIDVNSGVEASPGRKDPKKLSAFFNAIGR